MTLFSRITLFSFLAVVVIGCASTDVAVKSGTSNEFIAKPGFIYVFPFVSNPADIPVWSTAAQRHIQPSKLQTPEESKIGRELGAAVATKLVKEINDMGLMAVEGSKQSSPQINDIFLIGYFESIDEGSTTKRLLLGFGSGDAELKTSVEAYQMTENGLRPLGSADADSSSNKTPGLFVPIAVLAATANPIGLIVMGTAKIAGEVTGKGKIEGTAIRTAEGIAKELKIRFKARGWID